LRAIALVAVVVGTALFGCLAAWLLGLMFTRVRVDAVAAVFISIAGGALMGTLLGIRLGLRAWRRMHPQAVGQEWDCGETALLCTLAAVVGAAAGIFGPWGDHAGLLPLPVGALAGLAAGCLIDRSIRSSG